MLRLCGRGWCYSGCLDIPVHLIVSYYIYPLTRATKEKYLIIPQHNKPPIHPSLLLRILGIFNGNLDIELGHAVLVVFALVGFALFADAKGRAGDGWDGGEG